MTTTLDRPWSTLMQFANSPATDGEHALLRQLAELFARRLPNEPLHRHDCLTDLGAHILRAYIGSHAPQYVTAYCATLTGLPISADVKPGQSVAFGVTPPAPHYVSAANVSGVLHITFTPV